MGLCYIGVFLAILGAVGGALGGILTTLEGPFEPVTYPFDESFRGNAVDLPETDHRLQRSVLGYEPEQISVSLSFNYDSVWISWVTGNLYSVIDFICLYNLNAWKYIWRMFVNLLYS